MWFTSKAFGDAISRDRHNIVTIRLTRLGMQFLDGTKDSPLLDSVAPSVAGSEAAQSTPAEELVAASLADHFRLSPSAANAVMWANAARQSLGQSEIHMEHLLWGLMRKDPGPTRDLLLSRGVNDQQLDEIIRLETKTSIPPVAQIRLLPVTDLPPMSQHVREAFDNALRHGRSRTPPRVQSRDLLRGALEVTTCGMIRRLASHNITASSPSPPRDVLQDDEDTGPSPEPRADWLDAAPRFHREASADEHCLRVDEYATALAEALDTSNGEACFAIFGHWGRGKTHLARCVAALLQGRSGIRHRYATVWFSAWKYPIVPEVWVHLYESFARTAYDGTPWRGIPRAIRAKIERSGIAPIAGYLAVAGIGLLPLGLWLRLAWALVGWLGVVGLFAVFRIYRTIRGPLTRLATSTFSPIRHAEKLGLQATIGTDLQALICGWLRAPSRGTTAFICYIVSVIAFGVGLKICFIQVLERDAAWLLVGGWFVFATAVTAWIWTVGHENDRILLIVDDLDRCDPDHLVRVIESIRLHVAEPALEDRVQILALVEEDVLRWAIRRKFRMLVAASASHRERIEQDTLEKLFLAHLRLPPIGEGDLRDAMERFIDGGSPRPATSAESRPGGFHAVVRGLDDVLDMDAGVSVEPPGQTKSPSKPGRVMRDGSTPRVASVLRELRREDRTFSEDERQALLAVVPIVARHRPGSVGPRTMRSFVFRYQFARLLLRHRGEAIAPVHLATALASRLVPGSSAAAESSPALQAVLEEVV